MERLMMMKMMQYLEPRFDCDGDRALRVYASSP